MGRRSPRWYLIVLCAVVGCVLVAPLPRAEAQGGTAHIVWIVPDYDYRSDDYDLFAYVKDILLQMKQASCCWRYDPLILGIADYDPLGGVEGVIEALERTLVPVLRDVEQRHEYASLTIVGHGVGATWGKLAFLRERIPGGRLSFNRRWLNGKASIGDDYLWLNPDRQPINLRSDISFPTAFWPSYRDLLPGSEALVRFGSEYLNFFEIGEPWSARCTYREPPVTPNVIGCGAEWLVDGLDRTHGRNPFRGFASTPQPAEFALPANRSLRNEMMGMLLAGFAAGSNCVSSGSSTCNCFNCGGGGSGQWSCLTNRCYWTLPPERPAPPRFGIAPIGGDSGPLPPDPPIQCQIGLHECGWLGSSCRALPERCERGWRAEGYCNSQCRCDNRCLPDID